MNFYNDTFRDAANTLLVNHTSDSGATYSPHPAFTSPIPSAVEITAAIRMRSNAGAPNVFNISQAAPGPDHSMTCKVYIASTGSFEDVGPLCRVSKTAPTNWYSLTIYNGVVHLNKAIDGTYTQLGPNVSISESAGASFGLTLSCQGSTITGTVTRDSDGFYLTSTGAWQAAPANVFSFVDNSVPLSNNIGIYAGNQIDTDASGYQLASASASAVPALAPTPWQVLDVKAGFGAAGDISGYASDASISGADLTTATSTPFLPTHVGKTVQISNGTAGPPPFNAAMMPPPATPSFCCACQCGSLPATTYYVRLTYQSNTGESTSSPESPPPVLGGRLPPSRSSAAQHRAGDRMERLPFRAASHPHVPGDHLHGRKHHRRSARRRRHLLL